MDKFQPAEVGETEHHVVYTLGFIGGVISPETLRKVRELEEQRNNNDKPPKPPRRPNARIKIGRIAVSEGL